VSLADDIEAGAPLPRLDRCHACDRLADLDGRDRDALHLALTEKLSPMRYVWAAKKVSVLARKHGLMLPEAHVRDHRNQGHAA
jgi:hypothetical protein